MFPSCASTWYVLCICHECVGPGLSRAHASCILGPAGGAGRELWGGRSAVCTRRCCSQWSEQRYVGARVVWLTMSNGGGGLGVQGCRTGLEGAWVGAAAHHEPCTVLEGKRVAKATGKSLAQDELGTPCRSCGVSEPHLHTLSIWGFAEAATPLTQSLSPNRRSTGRPWHRSRPPSLTHMMKTCPQRFPTQREKPAAAVGREWRGVRRGGCRVLCQEGGQGWLGQPLSTLLSSCQRLRVGWQGRDLSSGAVGGGAGVWLCGARSYLPNPEARPTEPTHCVFSCLYVTLPSKVDRPSAQPPPCGLPLSLKPRTPV